MAPKQITITNNKGQALTEAIFLLSMTGLFLYFLLRCLLTVIFTTALDSMAEDYFFCELARKPNCEQRLHDRLRTQQMRDVAVRIKKPGEKIVLTISATHLASMTITREFDYEKFRQKF
ncbi:MAG: hypothetical protein V4654_14400 [Bdellovibrionota bacterium]